MKIVIERMKTGEWKSAIAYFDLKMEGNGGNEMVFRSCSLTHKDGKYYVNFNGEFNDGKFHSYAWVKGPILNNVREAALKEYEKHNVNAVKEAMNDGGDLPF